MRVTFGRLSLPLRHRWAISSGGKQIARNLRVELVDGDGICGRGEAAPSIRYQETAETGLAFLDLVDAARLSFSNLKESYAYLNSLAPGEWAAKAALDMALLDGAGQLQQCSVHDLLQLPSDPAGYVTSHSIGIDEPQVVELKAAEASAFQVLKLKAGVPHDAANLAALRRVAPRKPVRVDANEAWKSREEALDRLEVFAADGAIEFVEQPMPADSTERDLEWLRERSPLPLFADESFRSLGDLTRCAQCFHGVNVKLAKFGGVTPALEALRAARAAGLKTMIGCMIESSLSITAGVHLAALADHLDLDGHLLIEGDPFEGAGNQDGRLTLAGAPHPYGLQVRPRARAESSA